MRRSTYAIPTFRLSKLYQTDRQKDFKYVTRKGGAPFLIRAEQSKRHTPYSTLSTLAPFLLPAFLRLLPFSKDVASCKVLPKLSGFLTL